jgi:hypothetical protein
VVGGWCREGGVPGRVEVGVVTVPRLVGFQRSQLMNGGSATAMSEQRAARFKYWGVSSVTNSAGTVQEQCKGPGQKQVFLICDSLWAGHCCGVSAPQCTIPMSRV